MAIRTNDRTVLNRLVDRLPPGCRRVRQAAVDRLYSMTVGQPFGSTLRRFHTLYADEERLTRTVDVEAALDRFEADVKLHVAEAAHDRVFVHAGVVGWRGRAVVIPGLTMSGKSTLVAALIRAGATYYSDEYAVLDRRGRVHPYPRPLALREPGSPKQQKRSIESLGGRVGKRSLPVGLIVVTQYGFGKRWTPRRLSPGHGALAMLAHTVPARRDPRTALAVLRQTAGAALVLEGVRGEADETAQSILEELSRNIAVLATRQDLPL